MIYGHLQTIHVKPGDIVGPYTVVGEVGSEGNSTGCHLHWQLDRDTVGSKGDMVFVSPHWPTHGTEDPTRCDVEQFSLNPLEFIIKIMEGQDVSSL